MFSDEEKKMKLTPGQRVILWVQNFPETSDGTPCVSSGSPSSADAPATASGPTRSRGSGNRAA